MNYVIDNHIFAKKLEQRLRELGFVLPNGKIDKIRFYNAMYPETPITDETRRQDGSQHIVDLLRPISKWLKAECYPKTIDILLIICNVLQCDPTYFFTDELQAPTQSLQNASKALGVSYQALERLQRYSTDTRALLQYLIASDDFDFLEALLCQIQRYALSDGNSCISVTDNLYDSNYQITDATAIRAVLGKASHDQLDSCLMAASLLFKDK